MPKCFEENSIICIVFVQEIITSTTQDVVFTLVIYHHNNGSKLILSTTAAIYINGCMVGCGTPEKPAKQNDPIGHKTKELVTVTVL